MISSGPRNAPILILGEAPGETEIATSVPFSGQSGFVLDKMCEEAGFSRHQCFVTNVCHTRPPNNDISLFFNKKKDGGAVHQGLRPNHEILQGLEDLEKYISRCPPKLIIAVGAAAMWATTGIASPKNSAPSLIDTWRGSQLLDTVHGIPVVPTYHPAYILRDWSARWIGVNDLKRATRWLKEGTPIGYQGGIVRPSIADVRDAFDACRKSGQTIAVDIETRSGYIACIGLAWGRDQAICIPLQSLESPDGYWSLEDELGVTAGLRALMTYCPVVFHNGMFDLQYLIGQLGWAPPLIHDTMIAQSVCFPGVRKSLAFNASMYSNHYWYWKGMADDVDTKAWDPANTKEEELWTYNCFDVCHTWETHNSLQQTIDAFGLRAQYDFQRGMILPLIEMTVRGLRFDAVRRHEFKNTIASYMAEDLEWLEKVLGEKFNPESPLQAQKLFIEEIGLPPILHRKTKRPTMDDKALATYAKRMPALAPLVEVIAHYRSCSTYQGNFLEAKTSQDGRMRSFFNPAGPETFRLSSSKDVYGVGTNLQNWAGEQRD